MKTSRNSQFVGRGVVVALALLLLSGGAVFGVVPQATSGIYLEMDIENADQVQPVKMFLAPDRMRMDIDMMGQSASIVSIGGEAGKMLMIQHGQKMYMEFTAEMMAGLAAMGGQMPPEVAEEVENPTMPTFTRTGNTKQVGEWNAYEVKIEHPDQEGEMAMWFSPDVGADFRQVAEQFMSSMSSLLDNPTLGQMAGGGGMGGSNLISSIRTQLESAEIPDGFPVQIISGAGGVQSINTLRAIDTNASFDATTWVAPEGYTKMDMPFRR